MTSSPQLPIWISYSQALAVPIIAVVIAAFGAWIAARQMVIADEKLKLDAFDRQYDRRVAVYGGKMGMNRFSQGSQRTFCECVQFYTESQTLIGVNLHQQSDKIPWSRSQMLLLDNFRADNVAQLTQDRWLCRYLVPSVIPIPLHGLFFSLQGSKTELVHSRSAHQRLTGNSRPSMRTRFTACGR